MLRKKYRVPVQSFPKSAKTAFSGKLLVIKSSPNQLAHSRAGVVIRKGAVKSSAKRNKIKRIVVRAFENNPKVITNSGTDYLVIINFSDKLDGDVYGELTKELEGAIHKQKR